MREQRGSSRPRWWTWPTPLGWVVVGLLMGGFAALAALLLTT